MKTKNKEFQVSFLIKIDVSIPVKAANLQEALEYATSYTVKDVLDCDKNHNDNYIKVIGAYDNSDGANE